MNKTIVSLIAFALAVMTAGATPTLTSAKVTQVQNDVRLKDGKTGSAGNTDLDPAPLNGGASAQSERNAKVGDVVGGTRTLSTGKQSRAELLFNDNTVARLGANSTFSFKPGSRDIDLKSGFLLLHTPKGQGGAKISTPSAAASVLGTTIMLSALPDGGMKLVVLEGTAKVDYHGITQMVGPGQLVFLTQENGMSPAITVDLQRLVQSSGMIKDFTSKIGSEGLIQEAIKNQAEKIADGELKQSGYTIGGDQNGLNLLNAAAIEALTRQLGVVAQALSKSKAKLKEDATGAFTISPPASIDFGAPVAVSDTGAILPGVPQGAGTIAFSGDRFFFSQGPPASLLNLNNATTVAFVASGKSVDYVNSFNAIRFDNFQSAGAFKDLNLIFSAQQGSIGIFNSTFDQAANLTFHVEGRGTSTGNVDIANSILSTTGTGIFLNTTSGNIFINQTQLLTASNQGNQVLLDAPGANATIDIKNTVINTGGGSVPGGVTIPANEVTGHVNLENVQIIALNNVLAAPVRITGSDITMANTSIAGSTVLLGNTARSALITSNGTQNFISTNTGVDGLTIGGKLVGVLNVGVNGQPGTTVQIGTPNLSGR